MKIKAEMDIEKIIRMTDRLQKEIREYKGTRAGYVNPELVQIALANEFGTDEIPNRPFLRTAQRKGYAGLVRMFREQMKQEKSLKGTLARVGEAMKRDIKKSIDSNIPPPNSPETIARKKSSHTLIDTGRLKNSPMSELVKNNA
jgi:hypothetical protein